MLNVERQIEKPLWIGFDECPSLHSAHEEHAVLGGRLPRCVSRAMLSVIAVVAVSGCVNRGSIFTTKWAMNEERYALKHRAPYSEQTLEKWSQMGQELVDARFQEDNDGVFLGGGSALGKQTVGAGEVGFFRMPASWATVRFGGIAMDANEKPMAGGECGVRFHTPTRLAPYVGLEGVLELSGFAAHKYHGTSSRIKQGTLIYTPTGIAAIVPEAGVSYWLTSSTRLNLGASYYVTDNRQPDFLLVSLSLDVSLRDSTIPRIVPPRAEWNDEPEPYFIPVEASAIGDEDA